MIEVIYTEHCAGTYEDGLQVCVHCSAVLCDYTGAWASSDGKAPQGWPEGAIYVAGKNPVSTTTIRPQQNYGEQDPYMRKVVKCV